jgi:hypothetical protein
VPAYSGHMQCLGRPPPSLVLTRVQQGGRTQPPQAQSANRTCLRPPSPYHTVGQPELSALFQSLAVNAAVTAASAAAAAAACFSESWDLSGLSPPAAAGCTASRALWSAQQAGKDASDAVGKAAAESLQSLASQDEDEYYMNPNDPTRVSTGGGGGGHRQRPRWGLRNRAVMSPCQLRTGGK